MIFLDPVCGMVIRWEEAWAHAVRGDCTYYLCCPGCAALFAEQAQRFPCTGEAQGGVPSHTIPRIGEVSLDDFEALVWMEWASRQRSAACPARARTLERCIITLTLGDVARSQVVERLVAAELVRLRDPAYDPLRTMRALRRLPPALEAAAHRAGLSPGRARAARDRASTLLRRILSWSRSSHPTTLGPTTASSA